MFPVLLLVGIQALYMLGKDSTTESHLQDFNSLLGGQRSGLRIHAVFLVFMTNRSEMTHLKPIFFSVHKKLFGIQQMNQDITTSFSETSTVSTVPKTLTRMQQFSPSTVHLLQRQNSADKWSPLIPFGFRFNVLRLSDPTPLPCLQHPRLPFPCLVLCW